jgi:putative transposase
MLSLTYEYKLYPTPEQVQIIEHTLTVCRKVWNFALRERKDWINSRKCHLKSCSITSEYIMSANAPRPTYAQQCKTLNCQCTSVATSLKEAGNSLLRYGT